MLLDGHDTAAIQQAAQALAAGELLGLPTETVYGLAADASSDSAVAKIFAAKGRPSDHPLIVHIARGATGSAGVAHFAINVPAFAQALMDTFWPGPLTLILPRKPGVAAAAAGGQNSIGLRCPSHPVALALLRAAAARGVPGIAAPSANRFGRLSPTQAAHVVDELGTELRVLDGGDCDVGIESTIVDCSRGRAVLLRPGSLTRGAIEAALGQPLEDRDADAPRASGTLASHYAPRAKVRLMAPGMLRSALQLLATVPADATAHQSGVPLAVYSRLPVPTGSVVAHQVMPPRADLAAHELFTVLRRFDDLGAQLIWVEEPPAGPEWDGVRDRLWRACAH